MNFSEQNNQNCYLSIVIPVFNEEDNIEILLERLSEKIARLNMDHEIILVDDGSTDRTWEKIKLSFESNRRIRGIRLARNFGHQHALLAGLTSATGEVIVSMDGDLQHPPSLIEEMLKKHKEGYLVVNTLRNDGEVASRFKRTTSFLFYKVFSFFTDVPVSPGSSDFRLLDRVALDQLLKFNDVDLFLRGAVEWLGLPTSTLPYKADQRFSGSSKFSLAKMVRFANGSIISFSTKPLVIGIWVGLITSFLAFLEIIYVIIQWFSGETVPGWASTIGIVSLLFGILFIILGIVGTYLARIYIVLQNRPRFIISELLNPNKEHSR